MIELNQLNPIDNKYLDAKYRNDQFLHSLSEKHRIEFITNHLKELIAFQEKDEVKFFADESDPTSPIYDYESKDPLISKIRDEHWDVKERIFKYLNELFMYAPSAKN